MAMSAWSTKDKLEFDFRPDGRASFSNFRLEPQGVRAFFRRGLGPTICPIDKLAVEN